MSRSFAPGALVLALALAAGTSVQAQPAFQVADLGTTVTEFPPVLRAVVGASTYFTVDETLHGFELWRSDGTAAGTSLLIDLCPGSCSSSPYGLTVFGSLLYFGADDGENANLFRSDGTAAGTVPVFPHFSTLGQKHFSPLGQTGGKLLLLARSAGRWELWATDGTAAGTGLLKTLGPDAGVFDRGPLPLGRVGTTFFFSADDGVHGREPWKTDGTAAGTALVRDINPGSGDFLPLPLPDRTDFPAVSGALLFRACDAVSHCGIWRTDGTGPGTSKVSDLDPGRLSAWNGQAVFLIGTGLWKTDGTGPGTVQISPVPAGGDVAVAGSTIFVRSCDSQNCQLWKSDGTGAGTVPVGATTPYFSSATSFASNLTASGSRVLYYDYDPDHGFEPWVSDGTDAGTVPLADIVPGSDGSYGTIYAHFGPTRPRFLATPGGFLIVPVTPSGWELWGSDGTPGGTAPLALLDAQTPSLPDPAFSVNDQFQDLGDKTIFFANHFLWRTDGTPAGTFSLGASQTDFQFVRFGANAYYTDFQKLWQSDGTAAGTQVLWTGANPFLTDPVPVGDRLFWSAALFGSNDDVQLWKTDGTPAGTTLVRDLAVPGGGLIAALGNRLFWTPITAAGDLWVSDGSTAGTVPVTLPGQTASFFQPTRLTPAGGLMFFIAHGTQLWASDGTGAGTVQLGQFSSLAGTLVAAGSRLFFLADDGVHGSELWTSDGSAAGTHLVADLFPGPLGSFPASVGVFPYPIAALFGRVYFNADDGVHGRELWVSDGTAAGTHLLKDILPGAGSSLPDHLTTIGHLIFFSATDGVHSVELWQSDGTAAGTKMVKDIAPGDLPSNPEGFAASGAYIFFAANDATHGLEPWALPRAGLGGFLTATLTVAGQTEEGGTVTYTLTVTNAGAGPSLDNPGDEVADVLPAGLTLLSATAGSGTVTTDLPGNRVAWNGSLDPGASATITLQAQVGAGTFGTPLANQATLAFDADGDGSNESSGVSDDPARPGAADSTSFSPATAALGFYTVPPCRAVDTRGNSPLAPGTPRTFTVGGVCGIPTSARAVAANVTVVNPSRAGHLVVYPTGIPVPPASTLNFSGGQTRTNNVILSLGSFGSFDARASLASAGQLDLLLDVVGYYQ
jgi:uncharacterized repeat protein (TIGR01451 family)